MVVPVLDRAASLTADGILTQSRPWLVFSHYRAPAVFQYNQSFNQPFVVVFLAISDPELGRRRPPHRYRGACSALPSMLPVSNRFLYPQRNTSTRHTPRLFNVPSSLRHDAHWEGHSCALRLRCSKGYSLIDDRNRDCPMCICFKSGTYFLVCNIMWMSRLGLVRVRKGLPAFPSGTRVLYMPRSFILHNITSIWKPLLLIRYLWPSLTCQKMLVGRFTTGDWTHRLWPSSWYSGPAVSHSTSHPQCRLNDVSHIRAVVLPEPPEV